METNRIPLSPAPTPIAPERREEIRDKHHADDLADRAAERRERDRSFYPTR